MYLWGYEIDLTQNSIVSIVDPLSNIFANPFYTSLASNSILDKNTFAFKCSLKEIMLDIICSAVSLMPHAILSKA